MDDDDNDDDDDDDDDDDKITITIIINSICYSAISKIDQSALHKRKQ